MVARKPTGAELWTYQDGVDHILDVFGELNRQARGVRAAKRALEEAYRDLPFHAEWHYLRKRTTLKTDAPQSTGTVAYDHTGGASERLVTLTGATWPTNAEFYRIKFSGSQPWYPIERVLSTTTLTLPSHSNPGEDIAAGSSYQVARGAYPLPTDFLRLGKLFDVSSEREIGIVTDDMQHAESIWQSDTPEDARHAAIRNDGEYINSLSLVFQAPASAERKFDFLYQRAPRPLHTHVYRTGTVSLTAASSAVSSNGAAFTSAMIGAVLRVGDASNEPTSKVGNTNASDAWADNVYAEQFIIIDVPTASTLTLDSAAAASHSTVKFTISDPLDLEYSAMLTAFWRLAEWRYAELNKRDDEEKRAARFQQAISLAREYDDRTPISRGPVPRDPFRRPTITSDG